jgi:hypothetical protein
MAAYILLASAPGDTKIQLLAVGVAVIPLFAVPSLLKGSMNAAGSIGAKMAGWSSKANGKVGSKINDTSRFGAMKQHYQNQASRSRQLVQSGSYTGKNPISKGLSSMNRSINKSGLSGSFGQSRAAAGITADNELDEKTVSNTASLMRSELGVGNLSGAAGRLRTAIEKNNNVEARAAMRLLKVNGAGRNMMHQVINNTAQTDENKGTINAMKAEALTYGLKGQNILLDKWASNSAAYTDKDGNRHTINTTSDMSNNPEYNMFEGLSDAEIVSQSSQVVGGYGKEGAPDYVPNNLAKFKKEIDQARAKRILSNSSLTRDMDSKNLKIIQDIAGPAHNDSETLVQIRDSLTDQYKDNTK